MTKRKLLQVRISEELNEALSSYASSMNMTKSNALRVVLSEALLPKEDMTKVSRLAEEEGISVASWLRRAVKKALV